MYRRYVNWLLFIGYEVPDPILLPSRNVASNIRYVRYLLPSWSVSWVSKKTLVDARVHLIYINDKFRHRINQISFIHYPLSLFQCLCHFLWIFDLYTIVYSLKGFSLPHKITTNLKSLFQSNSQNLSTPINISRQKHHPVLLKIPYFKTNLKTFYPNNTFQNKNIKTIYFFFLFFSQYSILLKRLCITTKYIKSKIYNV